MAIIKRAVASSGNEKSANGVVKINSIEEPKAKQKVEAATAKKEDAGKKVEASVKKSEAKKAAPAKKAPAKKAAAKAALKVASEMYLNYDESKRGEKAQTDKCTFQNITYIYSNEVLDERKKRIYKLKKPAFSH